MKLLKAIGYGFVLFAIMFVLASVLMFGLKITGSAMSVLMILAGLAILWLLSKQYGISSMEEGAKVGLIWLIVDAALEYMVIVRMFKQGDLSFYTPLLFVGYATIVLIPAVYGKLKK